MEKIQSIFLFKLIMKVTLLQFILIITGANIALSQNNDVKHPVYLQGNQDIETLKQSVQPLITMSIKELIAQVPTQSGITFSGCPNCHGGVQDGALDWEPGLGDKIRCKFCQMVFPNEKFPNNREKVIIAPSGIRQVYRYHLSPEGQEYYFEARAWAERWAWINSMADRLAKVWFATKDNAYGDRAAAIAGRFAQVFPDYAIRFDISYTPKKFFPADQKWPYAGLTQTDYRGAKWSWWAYMDIPKELTNVYDILKAGYDWKRMDMVIGPETDKLVARDLLHLAYEFTAANQETYGNMAPGMYRDMLKLGRVLEDPSMVHEAVKRFRDFLSLRFFADGWWKEGTTSYHNQTIGGLRSVADALKGYTDPADWKGERFDNLDLTVGIPLYQKALIVTREAILPNGRSLPINDTWGRESRGGKTDHTVSHFWPALGNAAIGTGEGEDQIMLNINWSGNYNHEHYDNGSIMLYALGQELLPDIGYTHSKYGGWTTATASHNIVVIDQLNQDKGLPDKPASGQLKFYDDSDIHVKAIDLDASPAYAVARTYRRRLVMVHAGPGRDYVIDRFDVEGGKDHDWFLHGMCEQEGMLETSITLDRPLATLVPDWGGKEMPISQHDRDPKRFHQYMHLHDVKTGTAPSEKPWTATWRYDGGVGLRTYILSQTGTQVFRFRSPSIRLAAEDDNKVDKFMHTGIMQRNSEKTSTFIAVHEPFRNAPWIESVQSDGGTLVVRYTLNGAAVVDRITLSNGEVGVTSSAGWKYTSGTARSGLVEALESTNGKFRLRLDRSAPKVNYVRLDLGNNETRYYPVAAVQGNWLELVDDPGFTLETDGKIKFHTFPQDQHAGPLRYTLFVTSL